MAAFTLRSGHAVSLLLPERDWRPVRLTPDAASRRKLLGALAEAEPSGPARLGPSLPAIIGGRTQVRRRVLALVVLDVDDELVSALLKLRRQGVAVSVVHVAAEDGAAGRSADGGAGRRPRPRTGRRRRALRQAAPRRRPAHGPGGDAVATPGEGGMNDLRALLYVACFVGLAATAAVVTGGVAEPHVALPLLAAVAAGDARRRARARPPARLAAGAAPAAARRLPAGTGAGARARRHERRRRAPRLLRRPGPGRSGRLRPRRLPARRRRQRRPAAAAVAGGLRDGGRGRVPRAQPAPAPAGDRHPPRPRRLRLHRRRVGA